MAKQNNAKGKRAPRRRAPAKAAGLFKKKVLSVIHSQTENKRAFGLQSSTQYKGPMLNANSSFTRIIPSIVKGVEENQRVGDKINFSSLKLSMILSMTPQETGQSNYSRRLGVRVMVITPKSYGNYASSLTNTAQWENLLLKKGGAAVGFSGVLDDLYAPVNTDVITCHWNKVYKFCQGSFFQATGTSVNGIVSYENDTLVKFINKTFRYKNRVLKYDDSIDAGLTPTNLGMILAVGFVYLDGSAPDASFRIRLQYNTDFQYEDA